MACLTAGSTHAMRNHGVIDMTDMEKGAVRDARRSLAAALEELGLMDAFRDRSGAEIDRVIEACVDGFREGMRRRSDAGEIPF